jgi:hypothetical protein
MPKYIEYNREERAICAHLFRLLHENIDSKETSPFAKFLHLIKPDKMDLSALRYENIGIFCEVAIIRDAYYIRKPEIVDFMDNFTKILMQQVEVTNCTLFSGLSEILQDPTQTHPKQILQKASALHESLSENEVKVYGAMQGMFNAKPDLAITIDNKLLVFEAKFTEPFDEEQMERTRKIGEVWSKLLYEDLGFAKPPEFSVITLGDERFNPDISWTQILSIAEETFKPGDLSLIALQNGVNWLKSH